MPVIDIPPGTEIFGFMFSDATCGGWTHERHATEAQIGPCAEIGIKPVALIRLRMKHESLQAAVLD